jgi:preprotein translocase subunit SecD
MPQKSAFKLIFILFVILFFGYFLIPSIKFNLMSKEEKARLEKESPQEYQDLAQKSIKLGLDLQGGMNVVLEINYKELLNKLAQNKDDRFYKALNEASSGASGDDYDIVDALDAKIKELGGDIALYYSTREITGHDQIMQYLKEQTKEAINRSLEVLRNRVDEFGVSEPIIQKQGTNRIIVELAGITDREQAKELVGKTAKLEFSIVKDQDVARRVAQKINEYLKGQITEPEQPSVAEEEKKETPKDTSVVSGEELFGTDTTKTDSAELAKEEESKADEDFFVILPQGILIKESNANRFQEVMNDPEVQRIIQQEVANARFLLESFSGKNNNSATEDKYVPVYLVDSEPALTGETIVDARWAPGRPDDPASYGKFETNITFNSEGSQQFARVTGANEGKQMAIILDNRVQSAPNIREKIRGGRARITGLNSKEEAEVLASVLKAGSLPTPLDIIEERSVGPSLGKDSIQQGSYSAIIGLIFVAIFMIIYYKFSGFVADIALVLNIVLLLGVMSTLRATLTLPGIAGIILTIGMAVDANVLIFERVREELDGGKSIWAAIDIGYGRAFITILDANVTTFLTAVVLYNIGTGPVRGFATTLMIGLVASMFTAIFVTRAIFEFLLSKKYLKQLSI